MTRPHSSYAYFWCDVCKLVERVEPCVPALVHNHGRSHLLLQQIPFEAVAQLLNRAHGVCPVVADDWDAALAELLREQQS